MFFLEFFFLEWSDGENRMRQVMWFLFLKTPEYWITLSILIHIYVKNSSKMKENENNGRQIKEYIK